MKFFFSLVVLSLGLFAVTSPVPCPETRELNVRDTDPNTFVVPFTLYALFQTLEAVTRVTPTLGTYTALSNFEARITLVNGCYNTAIVTSAGPEGELLTSSVVPLLG
jgi:hypothetical protein